MIFWSVITTLVLVVISALCVLMFVNRDIKSAQTASDSFMSALQAKESDKAYDQAGKAFQASTDKLQLAQATAQMNERIQGEKLMPVGSVVSKTQNGTQAAVVYSVTHDNTTFYIRVVLDKIEGVWKVHNFRFAQQKLEVVVE